MKITAIKPAVKTPGRFNVFVDGAYAFSLDESQLVERQLRTGQKIDAATLDVLKSDSEFGKAYARVLDLVLRRLRSEKELYDYARRKEWDAQLTERVMKRLRERGYVDDRKFAQMWVRARDAAKPTSRRKLQLELRQKGVAAEIIAEVTQDDDHDELAALRRIVEKKRHRYSDEQKFMAYLVRQGFGYEAIRQVLAEGSS